MLRSLLDVQLNLRDFSLSSDDATKEEGEKTVSELFRYEKIIPGLKVSPKTSWCPALKRKS